MAEFNIIQKTLYCDCIIFEVQNLNGDTTNYELVHVETNNILYSGTVNTDQELIFNNLTPNTSYTLWYTNPGGWMSSWDFTTPEYIVPELTYSIWQSDQNLMGRVTIDNPGNTYEINLSWRELYELPVGQDHPNIYDGYDIRLDEDYTFTGLTNFEEGTQYKATIALEDSTGGFYQFDSNTIIIQLNTPSTLPIHISINGQVFQNCPTVKISVNGGEFKTLTNNALKII